jgi:hypothetical protein
MPDEKSITPHRESSLAPQGSLRATLRPIIASAAESVAESVKRAPELADETVGLVRALRLYWERRAAKLED